MENLYLLNINTLPDPKLSPETLEGLPPERAAKCCRYLKEEDRKRSLGAGKIIKKLTSDRNITYNSHGKPLADNIFFNISHSGEYVIGISSSKPIGCDIEKMKTAPLDVANQYFCSSEIKYIENSKNPSCAFWQLWTLKESYLKMSGEGISAGLDKFEIIMEDGISLFRDGVKQNCFMYSFTIDNHMVAICSENNLTTPINIVYL